MDSLAPMYIHAGLCKRKAHLYKKKAVLSTDLPFRHRLINDPDVVVIEDSAHNTRCSVNILPVEESPS